MIRSKQILPLLAFALALPAVGARANTYIVNSKASSNVGACDNNGECPLGAAIIAANNNPGPDTIMVSRSSSNIQLTAPLPAITDAGKLTLRSDNFEESQFPSNVSLQRANDQNNRFRLLNVAPGAVLHLRNFALSGGDVQGLGGAIYNAGTLEVENCQLTSNRAGSGGGLANVGGTATLRGCRFNFDNADNGGAIFNSDTSRLTLLDCSTFVNRATANGGFLANDGTASISGSDLFGNDANLDGGTISNAGSLTLEKTSVSSGSVGRFFGSGPGSGGALSNRGGTASVSQCSFNGNSASDSGSAIFSEGGSLTLSNSTISNGRGDSSSALHSASQTSIDSCTLTLNAHNAITVGAGTGGSSLSIGNSIVAGNAGSDVEGGSNLISRGHNIVGKGGGLAQFSASGDQPGVDPQLNPVAINGGAGRAYAPRRGSPAVDRGQTDLTTDQRGLARPQGGADDIGAVEGVPFDTVVSLMPRAPLTNDVLRASVTSSDTGGEPVSYSYLWKRISPFGTTTFGGLGPTFDLSKDGYGDKGDVITCEVSAATAKGGTASATASVTVGNSAPSAISREEIAVANVEAAFELKGFDPDGDPLTFKRVGGPANGVSADIRVDPADGLTKLFYKSRPRYSGVDVIRFVAIDSEGKTSAPSTLAIRVLYLAPPPANRAPIAGDTNIDTFVGKSEVKGLLGSDPDGDALTFRIVNNARYGKSEIKRDADGQFRLFYTSLNRFFGPDRVTYVATDSRGAQSNLATVNINFVNRAPVAQGNRVQVASGAEVSQFLFGTDEDGDVLSFRLVNNPRFGKGEVKLDAQGKWRVFYASLPGYVGPDKITFIAIDPQGRESSVATIDIDVVRVGGSSAGALMAPTTAPSGGGS